MPQTSVESAKSEIAGHVMRLCARKDNFVSAMYSDSCSVIPFASLETGDFYVQMRHLVKDVCEQLEARDREGRKRWLSGTHFYENLTMLLARVSSCTLCGLVCMFSATPFVYL